MSAATSYTLGELAARLQLELQGDADTAITGVATLTSAGSGQISFYHNQLYFRDLLNTRASAVILHPSMAESCPSACLLSAHPYLSYARLTRLFAYKAELPAGISPAAHVHPQASVDASATLGPGVIVGAHAVIAAGVVVEGNCVIGEHCHVGSNSRLSPNVTLYHGVRLGRECRIHSGVVIGSDGFGFARSDEGHEKIEQLGSVRIGDRVEIGANTTIDRGALDDTVIEDGVKIDNQVQIAHNVRIGTNSIICGCSAIAGSSAIGKNCIIAGAVGIINHVTICDDVTVTAMSLVNQSISEPGVYSSGTGLDQTGNWKKNIVRFRQLDEIWKKLLSMEKKLKKS